ncbi:hypothetical protein V5P93_002912 [Actinokineospora auranticolor]|uniref:Winged helix DNA-binding protein n=1 Tax=Actinokineospora auranticolor TaxID=155976 RepID=A0A2S6H0Q6_9PSEU|nr:hypothetical protein [Actinokineospora auranticolor]PPK71053.1 hypothetical protein CLV40_101239 [Actinokineospora auranticolor]
MTENEMSALRDVADRAVLFHAGVCGGPTGYLWASAEGSPAGRLPQWEADALTLLVRRGLVRVEAKAGATRPDPVRLTPTGARLFAA